jgi:hypothetical protein
MEIQQSDYDIIESLIQSLVKNPHYEFEVRMYDSKTRNSGNNGIYANGLFVGTVNAHWLQIISKMTII